MRARVQPCRPSAQTLDIERAKIVADLLYTGLVKGLSLVDRPDAPKDGKNATGDPFVTDGRMAVVEF